MRKSHRDQYKQHLQQVGESRLKFSMDSSSNTNSAMYNKNEVDLYCSNRRSFTSSLSCKLFCQFIALSIKNEKIEKNAYYNFP